MPLYVNFSSFELPKNSTLLKKKLVEIRTFLKKNKIKFIEISYPRISNIEKFFFDKFKDYKIIFDFNEINTLDELKKCIKISQKFKSNIIRIKFSNYLEFKRDPKKNFEKKFSNFISILNSIKNFIKKNNFYIAIENHQDIDSHDFERIFKKVKSNNIGMCFDIANSIATCELPETYIKKFHDKLFLVHVKNYKIYYQPNDYIQLNSTSIVSGSLDVLSLIKQIKKNSKCKIFSIEIGNKKSRFIKLKENSVTQILKTRNTIKQNIFIKFLEKFKKPCINKKFNVYDLLESSICILKKNKL